MSACLPHLIHDLRHDRVVVNRKTNRIGARLRFSGWLPPGLVLGCLAVLAAFIHGPVKLLTVWAATSGFVVLTAITVWGLQRRAASPTPAAQFKPTGERSSRRSAQAMPTMRLHPRSMAMVRVQRPRPQPHHRCTALRRRKLPSGGSGVSPQPGAATGAELAVALGLHVLTTAEAGSVLRVDAQEIAKAISSGELPGNRIGGDWRVDLGALRRWLQGRYPAPGALSGPAAHAAFGDEQN